MFNSHVFAKIRHFQNRPRTCVDLLLDPLFLSVEPQICRADPAENKKIITRIFCNMSNSVGLVACNLTVVGILGLIVWCSWDYAGRQVHPPHNIYRIQSCCNRSWATAGKGMLTCTSSNVIICPDGVGSCLNMGPWLNLRQPIKLYMKSLPLFVFISCNVSVWNRTVHPRINICSVISVTWFIYNLHMRKYILHYEQTRIITHCMWCPQYFI